MPNEVIIDGVRYAPDISSTPNADAFFVLLQKSRVENAALNARLEEIEGQAESENTALKARLAEAEERLVAARYLIDGLLNVRDPFIRVKATEWLRAADSADEVQL